MSRRPQARGALLDSVLRDGRPALSRIALWSVLEALPSLMSGVLVSQAVGKFLDHQTVKGFESLSGLLLTGAIGAIASRQILSQIPAVVESAREVLMTTVVYGAIATSIDSVAAPDASPVALLTQQVQAALNALADILRDSRQVAISLLASFAGLAWLSPEIALFTGLLLLLSVGVLTRLTAGLAKANQELQEAESEVAREAGAAFMAIRDLLAYSMAEKATERIAASILKRSAISRDLARMNAVRNLTALIGGQIPLLVLLVTAPWLIQRGLSSIQVLGAATYLSAGLEPALRALVSTVGDRGLQLAIALRVLTNALGVDVRPAAGRALAPAEGYDLSIRDVTFSHERHASPVLKGLTLELPADSHLAVIGPSGVGKSTLALLIAGLLRPQRGEVTVGGEPTQGSSPNGHSTVMLIPQEAYVFAGTLRENLAYLAPDASDGEIATAVQSCGAEALLNRVGGLDAETGAGAVQLSDGERQLIALIRVYLSPARLVVLDEATSHLDPATEAVVETAFTQRKGTLIVIAHRLSSAERAEQILVLSHGNAEFGTHTRLLGSSSLYRELYGRWTATGVSS